MRKKLKIFFGAEQNLKDLIAVRQVWLSSENAADFNELSFFEQVQLCAMLYNMEKAKVNELRLFIDGLGRLAAIIGAIAASLMALWKLLR